MDLLELGVLQITRIYRDDKKSLLCNILDLRRRQIKRVQRRTDLEMEDSRKTNSSKMDSYSPSSSSCCCSFNNISPIISIFVCFLFLVFFICPAYSTSDHLNQTFRPENNKSSSSSSEKFMLFRDHLMKINKPAIKTIQSPDGDLIDCVLSHQQPAFDHPKLKGQKPLDAPERPKRHKPRGVIEENYQMWSMTGETCPEGTVPIRRTKKQDLYRANSIQTFGRKLPRSVTRDTSSNGHEHAVGYVSGDEYYGAKASINVWAPKVTSPDEFSISQLWVIAGSFGDDLNTIEAGWQVSPELYGDYYPRFFTYWTSDAYQATGCYNLLCSGFVQTNNHIAIGAAISPTSSYSGGQFDISLLIWKDPKHGNWWLEYGSGVLVGYWPSVLFTHLQNPASMVQFGGEIVNGGSSGFHTSTQMGSGHFAGEGFGKASYFRNLQVVDWDNSLIPLSNLRVLADHSNCYDIQGGINQVWGNYFYYGGPGRNSRCP